LCLCLRPPVGRSAKDAVSKSVAPDDRRAAFLEHVGDLRPLDAVEKLDGPVELLKGGTCGLAISLDVVLLSAHADLPLGPIRSACCLRTPPVGAAANGLLAHWGRAAGGRNRSPRSPCRHGQARGWSGVGGHGQEQAARRALPRASRNEQSRGRSRPRADADGRWLRPPTVAPRAARAARRAGRASTRRGRAGGRVRRLALRRNAGQPQLPQPSPSPRTH
jgi:hypothetical protein